jgi:hypothetical protein
MSAYMLNNKSKPVKIDDRLHILYSMIEKEGEGIRQSSLDVIFSKTEYDQSDVEVLVKKGVIEKMEKRPRQFFYQLVGTRIPPNSRWA